MNRSSFLSPHPSQENHEKTYLEMIEEYLKIHENRHRSNQGVLSNYPKEDYNIYEDLKQMFEAVEKQTAAGFNKKLWKTLEQAQILQRDANSMQNRYKNFLKFLTKADFDDIITHLQLDGMHGYLLFEDDLNNKKTFVKVIDQEPHLYQLSLEKKITNKANYLPEKSRIRVVKDKENLGTGVKRVKQDEGRKEERFDKQEFYESEAFTSALQQLADFVQENFSSLVDKLQTRFHDTEFDYNKQFNIYEDVFVLCCTFHNRVVFHDTTLSQAQQRRSMDQFLLTCDYLKALKGKRSTQIFQRFWRQLKDLMTTDLLTLLAFVQANLNTRKTGYIIFFPDDEKRNIIKRIREIDLDILEHNLPQQRWRNILSQKMPANL